MVTDIIVKYFTDNNSPVAETTGRSRVYGKLDPISRSYKMCQPLITLGKTYTAGLAAKSQSTDLSVI